MCVFLWKIVVVWGVCICMCVWVCVTCAGLRVHVYMCPCVCVCECIYVHMFVWCVCLCRACDHMGTGVMFFFLEGGRYGVCGLCAFCVCVCICVYASFSVCANTVLMGSEFHLPPPMHTHTYAQTPLFLTRLSGGNADILTPPPPPPNPNPPPPRPQGSPGWGGARPPLPSNHPC